MDSLTWLSLGLQLAALASIVGALLLYLLRKVRGAEAVGDHSCRTVLVTSVDTALGLQIATYLSGRGWRVVGGCRAGGLGARLAASWAAAHAPGGDDAPAPRLATVELDVAREDVMEQAARATAQHLPAGEHGVWAVINTAGCPGRGGPECWESVLRSNVLGALRVARSFTPLLAAAAGKGQRGTPRLFYIGLSCDTELQESGSAATRCEGEGGAATAAARWAVCGAGAALRGALRARGVHVGVLHAPDLSAAELFSPPALVGGAGPPASRPDTPSSDSGTVSSCSVTMPGEAAEYSARVLTAAGLRTLEDALASGAPRNAYHLHSGVSKWFARVPSLRLK